MSDLIYNVVAGVFIALAAYWAIAMIWLFANFVLNALGYDVYVEKRRD